MTTMHKVIVSDQDGNVVATLSDDDISAAADLVQSYDPNWNVAELTVVQILKVALKSSGLQPAETVNG